MKFYRLGFLFLQLFFYCAGVYGQTTYTLLATCDTDDECSWNNGSSWVGGVAPLGGTPSSGDIIIIPAGTWVEIVGPGSQTQITNEVIIQVYGTLDFDGNARLELLDMNSVIQLASTAVLDVSNTTGNSARIQIGTTTIKSSDIAAIVSPNQLTEGNLDGGGCAVTMDCPSDPLPVELMFFSAEVYNECVELSWATASEENFDYFAIERSIDGKDFKEIAQVTGNGNSFQRIDYTYTDKFPAIGISYYRLRSIDFDGYTEIFDYAIVNVEGVKYQAEVFPNPVTSGVLNVQLNFNLEEEAKVLLYNNVGLVELELAIDSWLNPLDVTSLTSGSYLIKIITSNGIFVERILIK